MKHVLAALFVFALIFSCLSGSVSESYAQITPHKFLTGYSYGGPVFSVDFLSGKLDSRLTFSRQGNATMFDSTGENVVFPAAMVVVESAEGSSVCGVFL